jgi:nitronate monooxygenase
MPADDRISSLLQLKVPIVQGPFGGGISTVELTSNVSNRGGLGSFGAHILTPDEILETSKAISSQTSEAFALNLWVEDHDPEALTLSDDAYEAYAAQFKPYYDELSLDVPKRPNRFHESFEDQAEAILEVRPPALSFVFGIPSAKVLEACKKRGITTIGAATSVAEAMALDQAGVDAIVATGFEAGGHRPSFLKRAEDSLMSTGALVQTAAVRIDTPLIAAGGIVDGQGVAAARILGASAAQLGTAFLACDESGTTDAHRKILFDKDAVADTTLTRTYTGRLARGIRNRLIEELERPDRQIAPFPVQAWFVGPLKKASMRDNKTDLTSLYAGQSAPNLQHRNVPSLMHALTNSLNTQADAA